MASSDTQMEIETMGPATESDIGITNGSGIQKTQTDSGPEIGIEVGSVSNEPEMEIQIGAVFSLASIDDNKQNESLESGSLGSQSSFTGSTVSAREDDSLNVSQSDVNVSQSDVNVSQSDVNVSQSDVTNAPLEENNVDDKLYFNSIANESTDSTTYLYGKDVSPVHSETSPPEHKDGVSGYADVCAAIVNKKTKNVQIAQNAKYVVKSKTSNDFLGFENIKKYSYCYVKLSDVLTHSVIKREVVKMEKKYETMEVEENKEKTAQDKKKQHKPPTRKKKPVRITMKKCKKKKPVLKQKDQPEAVVAEDPPKLDKITENSQNRPSRKRKFNHNLFTDAVVFDSRGICNYADHEIKTLEEEDYRRGRTTIYGFRGSRPQVARTKKKLCRVKREDMPFISVKLDKQQIDKLDKSKSDVSKSVAVVKSIKGYTNHQLQKIADGSFRILKNWSKGKLSRHVRNSIKKNKSSSKVDTAVMMEDRSMSVAKEKEESTTIPLHQQKMTDENQNVDTRSIVLSKKPAISNSKAFVPPVHVKVEQSGVSSYDESKGTMISNEPRVSLTGRYRKPSKKYSSFITNFERFGSAAKLPTKTGVKLEQPFIEMDIAVDAEGTVRQDHLNGAMGNTKKSNNSGAVTDRMYKQEPNLATLPGQCTTPKLTTGSSTTTKLPRPVQKHPTFVMKSQSVKNVSSSFPPNLFKSTVNELARVQNTKKFFQLRVGDKMVLIPADGGDIVPKAYVIDVANTPSAMKTTEKKTHIADFSSQKSSEVSSNKVNAEKADIEMDKKSESLGRAPASTGSLSTMFPHSVNQQVTSVRSAGSLSGGQLTINTGSVLKQALFSSPPLSSQMETESSLISNSRHNPPVLIPKGLVKQECLYDDAQPPVLRQEIASCDGDIPNPSQMKSILPKVLKGPSLCGEPARTLSDLPVDTGDTPPELIVNPNEPRTDSVVVKKEPDHIKDFDVGPSTKDTTGTQTNKPSTLFESRETCSSTNEKEPSTLSTLNNADVSEKVLCSSGEASGSDNTGASTEIASTDDADSLLVVKFSNETNQSSSCKFVMEERNRSVTLQTAHKDHDKTGTSSDSSFVSNVDNESNPQSDEAFSHREPTDTVRERSIVGIETVTHVPADETLVQERIRKLRERLRETQADLDIARKTIRIKKEYSEDDS